MNLTELRQVAYIGDDYVRGPIKAVILRLHGLGYAEMRQNLEPEEYVWAMNGGLVVLPYYGPWSWMNRQARQMVDQVVEGVYREFKLQPSVPLIPVGTSMGGCTVLLYCRYGKHAAAACSASAAPCDMPFSFSERPDIPRTLKMAFWGYPEPFDQVLREHSPLHQVGAMPDIPYFFMHGNDDVAVHKQPHSDKMVAALRQRGFKVEYHEVPGYGHAGGGGEGQLDLHIPGSVAADLVEEDHVELLAVEERQHPGNRVADVQRRGDRTFEDADLLTGFL